MNLAEINMIFELKGIGAFSQISQNINIERIHDLRFNWEKKSHCEHNRIYRVMSTLYMH